MKFLFAFVVVFFAIKAAHADNGLTVGCPTIVMSGSSVSCYGGSDGTAAVSISPAGSYTISWSNGQTATNLVGLSVGTYTVNVKNTTSGCTVVGAFVVTQPDPILITSSFITNVNCYGESTGGVSVSLTGGTPVYNCVWKNSANTVVATSTGSTSTLTGMPAGTDSLIVTDSEGCILRQTYTITQPIEALNSSEVVQNVSCFTGNNGSIDVSVWGGTPPYAYSWSNTATTQDISGLTASAYNLTITDTKGCTKDNSYNITQPTQVTSVMSSTDVNCFGGATGSVSVSVSGGTPGYSYSWQNSTTLFSANTATLNNVVADIYSVVATDSKGCTTSGTVTVNQPPLLTATAVVTNVKCYGQSTGIVDLTVVGGSVPYSYAWTNSLGVSFGTGADITNVPAGIYTVVVTDSKGCTFTLTEEVLEPLAPLSSSYEVTNVLCYGNNTGAIDLTVQGGTTPYTYTWTSGQTTQDVNFLLAGTYGYGVLDANLCPVSGSVVIIQPAAPLNVTNVITNVNCFGESNGTIDLTVTGGTVPYTYTWENSVYELSIVSQDLVNFPAETYTYLVTDAHGCTSGQSLTITEPALLISSVTGVNILCYGGNNGSVDLTVAGGTLPYSYNWNSGSTSQDLINLIAGTYSVTVTDAHNCTTSSSITLTQPDAPLSFTFTTEDVKCNNGSDGSIDLVIEGGTEPYTYAWSNGGTLSSITDLTAGMYSFLVTDFNGCTISGSMEIFQPDALTLNEVITPVTCYGFSDGVIDISPVGGTTPYQFTWFNSDYALSAQTEDLSGWPADVYQVEIIDSNNCFYEMFFEIEQPEILAITYTYSVVSCNGGADANILVDITGGNPAYTTTWSNGATTEDLLNIPAGYYELIVVDTKGCTDSIEATIEEPLPVTMTFEVTEITCIDQKDGTAYVNAAGGNGGFTYLWSNGETTPFIDSLDNLWYFMTVTDVLGCTGSDSVFIPKNPQVCVDPVTAFSPNGDNYNDTWFIENMQLYPDAEMQIFNRWGNLIHQQTGVYEPWNGEVNGVPMPSDVYYFILNLNFPGREPLHGNITIVR